MKDFEKRLTLIISVLPCKTQRYYTEEGNVMSAHIPLALEMKGGPRDPRNVPEDKDSTLEPP